MDIKFNLRGEIIKIPRYEFEVISRESWFISNLVNNTESNNQEDIYNLWEDKNIFIFGGGDSALDWTVELSKVSKSIYCFSEN